MKRSLFSAILAHSVLMLSVAAVPASADFAVNIGAIGVFPDDSSSSLHTVEQVASLPAGSTALSVNDNVQLGISFDYIINKNWTVELIAATPFSHDIKVKGSAIDGLKVGDTKHLPPTLLLQYHFDTGNDAVSPFLGVGVNYTRFFDEKISGDMATALHGLNVMNPGDKASLKLGDSWGAALQAGINIAFSDRLGLHLMVSKMDIDTTGRVKLNGTTIETVDVKIDPLVAMAGLRFRL